MATRKVMRLVGEAHGFRSRRVLWSGDISTEGNHSCRGEHIQVFGTLRSPPTRRKMRHGPSLHVRDDVHADDASGDSADCQGPNTATHAASIHTRKAQGHRH